MKKNSQEQELKILHQIIQTISYNLDLKEVLERIVKVVSQATKADSCFIYLKGDGELVLRASKNPRPKAIGKIKLKVGEGITGWVAGKQKTVAITNKAYEDERFKFFNVLPEDKYEAFLSVPIIYKDKVLGVINVQHRKLRNYKKQEIEMLETIARATGGAIENASLFSEKEALKEALETRKILARAKGILMKELKISEEEAYKLLHKKSMDKRLSMKEVAEAVIISSELRDSAPSQ
ncbi:ANTAR domain-containing protein [Patescibacteria group bacterium]|nr:ANTAR domain-containing protein [Patescibacteria group bacterium]